MFQNTNTPGPRPKTADDVCQTRIELLDRLAGAVEKLGRAKLQLRQFLELGPLQPGEFGEVEALRTECGAVRAELESHRAAHGC